MINAPLSSILPAFYRLESWGETCRNESSMYLLSERINFPRQDRKRLSFGVLRAIWGKVGLRRLHAHSQWWVIMVQACGPDCCITVWKWSSSDRDVKCSGRIWCVCVCVCSFARMPYFAFASQLKGMSQILLGHSCQSWRPQEIFCLFMYFLHTFVLQCNCKRVLCVNGLDGWFAVCLHFLMDTNKLFAWIKKNTHSSHTKIIYYASLQSADLCSNRTVWIGRKVLLR